MSIYRQEFTGTGVSPTVLAAHMGRIAGLTPHYDAGMDSPASGKVVRTAELTGEGKPSQAKKIENSIRETWVGGDIPLIIRNVSTHAALIDAKGKDRLCAAALLRCGQNHEGNPELSILAFGADTYLREERINSRALTELAGQIAAASRNLNAQMNNLFATPLRASQDGFEQRVRFSTPDVMHPKVDAERMPTALELLMGELKVVSETLPEFGHKFNEKMVSLGTVLTHVSSVRTGHPVSEAIGNWRALQEAGSDLAVGSEEVYRSVKRVTSSALGLLRGVLAGVRGSGDYLYPDHPNVFLSSTGYSEDSLGSFHFAVMNSGHTPMGEAKFTAPLSQDGDPKVEFMNFAAGTGVLSKLAGQVIEYASKGRWMQRKTW